MAERSAKEIWEAVLAEVEEDVRRTQLHFEPKPAEPKPAEPVPAPLPAPGGAQVPPAQAMLPSVADGPTLPPLATMPPVPAELRGRILTVLAHIDALRQDFEEQLSQWLATTAPESNRSPRRAAPAASSTPRFVDRAL
jgi:hypothetical protein